MRLQPPCLWLRYCQLVSQPDRQVPRKHRLSYAPRLSQQATGTRQSAKPRSKRLANVAGLHLKRIGVSWRGRTNADHRPDASARVDYLTMVGLCFGVPHPPFLFKVDTKKPQRKPGLFFVISEAASIACLHQPMPRLTGSRDNSRLPQPFP